MTPCDSLSLEDRAQRVASTSSAPVPGGWQPGYCRICGARLRVSYEAMQLVDGKWQVRQAETGSAAEAKILALIASGEIEKWREKGWVFTSMVLCPSINEEVFTRSQAIKRARKPAVAPRPGAKAKDALRHAL